MKLFYYNIGLVFYIRRLPTLQTAIQQGKL